METREYSWVVGSGDELTRAGQKGRLYAIRTYLQYEARGGGEQGLREGGCNWVDTVVASARMDAQAILGAAGYAIGTYLQNERGGWGDGSVAVRAWEGYWRMVRVLVSRMMTSSQGRLRRVRPYSGANSANLKPASVPSSRPGGQIAQWSDLR
jgi:hypothetical protein